MGSCFQSAGLFSFFIWVTIPQLGAFRHSDDCTLRSFKKNEILRGFKLQLQAHQLPLEVFEFIASVRLSSLSNPIFVTSKFTLLVLSNQRLSSYQIQLAGLHQTRVLVIFIVKRLNLVKCALPLEALTWVHRSAGCDVEDRFARRFADTPSP